MDIEQFKLITKGTTSFCLLAKITPLTGNPNDILRLALHTRDIPFGGETYKSVYFDVSDFETTAGTSVDNVTFSAALGSALSRHNITGGKWQGAKIKIYTVDYQNLDKGAVEKKNGRLGNQTLKGYTTEAEYRGLMQLLAQEIGDKTSRLCRNQLGVNDGINSFCPVDIDDFTFTGTVTAVTNRQKFNISVSKDDRFFYRGQIKWTSGANSGLAMETQNNEGTLLTLFMPMIGAIQIGDAFSIVRGDDKTLETCHGVFDAAMDFNGEPDIPEREKLYKFPD